MSLWAYTLLNLLYSDVTSRKCSNKPSHKAGPKVAATDMVANVGEFHFRGVNSIDEEFDHCEYHMSVLIH
jgi:hypothetical protein